MRFVDGFKRARCCFPEAREAPQTGAEAQWWPQQPLSGGGGLRYLSAEQHTSVDRDV